jgi:hypothetical protein
VKRSRYQPVNYLGISSVVQHESALDDTAENRGPHTIPLLNAGFGLYASGARKEFKESKKFEKFKEFKKEETGDDALWKCSDEENRPSPGF